MKPATSISKDTSILIGRPDERLMYFFRWKTRMPPDFRRSWYTFWTNRSYSLGVIAPPSLAHSLRPHNTGDKLRSSIACAGFVCFIPLFDGPVFLR